MGIVAFLYGVVSYVLFLASFLYAIGFVGNLMVPKGIDGGAAGDMGQALLVNLALLGGFAIQHSVMARPGFKKAWTKIVPESVERSTFVLVTSLLFFVMFKYWQPMPAVVWSIEGAGAMVLTGLFWLGWLIVLTSTFMINHFDLFGLRQVFLRLQGKEYHHVPFQKNFLYHYVRHPIMLGFIIAFWATPTMTQGHLLFAVATTGYILIALVLEERDLLAFLGEDYARYRREVPKLLPLPRAKASS